MTINPQYGLVAVYILMAFLNFLAMFTAWRWQKHYPGTHLWVIGSFCAMLTWLPYIFSGRIDGGWQAFVAVQLMITCLLLYLAGSYLFLRNEIVPMAQIILYAVATLVNFHFSLLAHWVEMRVIVIGIYFVLACGYSIFLHWNAPRNFRPAVTFINLGALILFGLASYRILAMALEVTGKGQAWTDINTASQVNFVGMVFGLTSWSFGFLFAIACRYESEMMHLADRFQHEALHDPLTELGNRRQFTNALEQAVNSYNRYGHSASLVMLDIDHFKQINDRYGHHVGDLVLIHVAQRLARHCRTSDQIARVGGEEFALLLIECPQALAVAKAEHIRKDLADSLVRAEGLPLKITASFGVAHLRAKDTADVLFTRADEALYRAKANGRNQVEQELMSQISGQLTSDSSDESTDSDPS